jgi:hypothetical protein
MYRRVFKSATPLWTILKKVPQNTESGRLDMRFSLRAILVVFVCLAVGFTLLFSTTNYIALPLLILLAVALPATLAAGTVYTRGTWQAFCIGGLFPSGLMLYITGWMLGLSIFECTLGDYTARAIRSWKSVDNLRCLGP